MPFLRRIGRGGLLQAAARTAVIAGTATAVSGGIRRYQERDDTAPGYEQAAPVASPQPLPATMPTTEQLAAAYPGYPAPQPQAGPGPAAGGPANAGDDLLHQLDRLAALHQRGALTAEEFGAAKAKLLGL